MILFGLHSELKVRNNKTDSRRHHKVPVRKDVNKLHVCRDDREKG